MIFYFILGNKVHLYKTQNKIIDELKYYLEKLHINKTILKKII
jgi:hypothetical protein